MWALPSPVTGFQAEITIVYYNQILLWIQREKDGRVHKQCVLVSDGHFQAGMLLLSFWPL